MRYPNPNDTNNDFFSNERKYNSETDISNIQLEIPTVITNAIKGMMEYVNIKTKIELILMMTCEQ